MADNSNDILKKLQQYGIPPPADAFEKAWERIAEEKEWTEKRKFAQLQEYAVAAPSLDFELLKNKKKEKETPVRSIIPLAPARVAAILVIVGTAAALYFTIFNKKESPSYSVQQDTIQKKQVDTGEMYLTAKDTVDANKDIAASPITSPVTNRIEKPVHIRNIVRKSRKGDKVSFGQGNTAQVYDNDLLLTLVSYKGGNSQWQSLFTDAVADKKITLNKYSWVNLSDKMVSMLQDIYGTKKNGKPTRAAKRTKKKFEKWRKKDEKYFDRNMQKNPVDIIDLSEFILE